MTNCIDNIISSQNLGSTNSAAINLFKKENNSQPIIQAPNSLPKFSINKALLEDDEFRKNAISQYSNKKSKKTSFFKPIFLACIVLGTTLLVKSKLKK